MSLYSSATSVSRPTLATALCSSRGRRSWRARAQPPDCNPTATQRSDRERQGPIRAGPRPGKNACKHGLFSLQFGTGSSPRSVGGATTSGAPEPARSPRNPLLASVDPDEECCSTPSSQDSASSRSCRLTGPSGAAGELRVEPVTQIGRDIPMGDAEATAAQPLENWHDLLGPPRGG